MRAILTPGVLPATIQAKAASILRACVHCGFCNATCPTYQVLGDELDGPRGRIYLMKSLLEGGEVSATTQTHLDRCLGCRACETTCPSGVQYNRLLELVRPRVDARVPRTAPTRLKRWLLRKLIPYPTRFGTLLAVGRIVRGFLPAAFRRYIPAASSARYQAQPVARPRANYVLFEGCVQERAAPQINRAAAQILSDMQITLQRVGGAGCCGALPLHLGAMDEAKACARRNIDAWTPFLEGEMAATGVFCASSGCTQVMKDYGHLLRHDPTYASRASRMSALICDAGEVIDAESIRGLCLPESDRGAIAFQAPCSLQHGLKGHLPVNEALRAAGYRLLPVAESHLCCGSAGSYSLLQPAIATALRSRKLAALSNGAPEAIASANIGCLLYLQQTASVPVRHWLELVADAIAADAGIHRTQ